MLQRDSCTFIFFIELLLIGWLVEMLKLQKCSGRGIIMRGGGGRGETAFSQSFRAARQETSGWAAGELVIKIEPYSEKYILVHDASNLFHSFLFKELIQ